ncbi:hypothetical protein IQ273_08580 [Nodosilinea sp. LEGE 07298]|uniref:hypothetical protein n=1 Tax=Nodosilinea sp. LEGE 07298 TaxID=2777970 RepID=UPI00187F4F95|nr:hypothetical protein [Nodosilinea sp. LEGE 07298]MBE9109470.1 hypothetical protein [Nodosilinea sp. LEGE 07298]
MSDTTQIQIESAQAVVHITQEQSNEARPGIITITRTTGGSSTEVLPPIPCQEVSFEVVFNYESDSNYDDYSAWCNYSLLHVSIIFYVNKRHYILTDLTLEEGYQVCVELKECLGLPFNKRHEVVSRKSDGLYESRFGDNLDPIARKYNLYYETGQKPWLRR